MKYTLEHLEIALESIRAIFKNELKYPFNLTDEYFIIRSYIEQNKEVESPTKQTPKPVQPPNPRPSCQPVKKIKGL